MARLARGSAIAIAIAAALTLPASAAADIAGTLTNTRGVPIVGEGISVTDANGDFVDFATTDAAGKWTTPSSDLSGQAPPFTAKVTSFDSCDQSGNSTRETSAAAVDGQTWPLQLDLLEFCAANSFGTVEGTAFIDELGRTIISAPGGTANIQVLAPSNSTNISATLPDGTVLGTSPDDERNLPLTLPGAPYNGPFNVNYTASGGSPVSFAAGTLIVAQVGPANPARSNLDLEAIVDLSGSMSGTDPKFRRKDAVGLLLDLAKRGDKLGAVGFDDQYQPIFDLTTISGTSVIKNLKTIADQKIINSGGTNYNVAFDEAYKALTGPKVDPKRPKGAIFLTDGGHNSGAYRNGHLRFALNPSGHTWPVCVVQLGTNFQPEDVARLQRIATDTGGQYVAAPTDDQLVGLYFSCLGLTTGAKTVVNRTFTFSKPKQKKAVKRRLPRKRRLPSVTFFVNWGEGTYNVQLIDPKRKKHTPKRPGRGVSFGKGSSYAFYRINRPLGGVWRMVVKAVALPEGTDQANVKITVTPGKKKRKRR